jgi:hypothetical protein
MTMFYCLLIFFAADPYFETMIVKLVYVLNREAHEQARSSCYCPVVVGQRWAPLRLAGFRGSTCGDLVMKLENNSALAYQGPPPKIDF